MELSQSLINGRVPAIFVEATCETTVRFVEERIDPVLFRAAMKSLLTPGLNDWFLLQVPFPALKTASSPLMTTRVEPARVFVPEIKMELAFTSVKNAPDETEADPGTSARSAI